MHRLLKVKNKNGHLMHTGIAIIKKTIITVGMYAEKLLQVGRNVKWGICLKTVWQFLKMSNI